jgi:hypothetical protein
MTHILLVDTVTIILLVDTVTIITKKIEIQSFMTCFSYKNQNGIKDKGTTRIGYSLIDMLGFWHIVVYCTSFGFLPKITLLLCMWVPF